jgi:diguanylate cyclase (GGDEF)-like protein/PAS domain S-box-containing protein
MKNTNEPVTQTAENNDKFKILIVDDSAVNLEIVSCILRKQGYELAVAKDGATAISLTKSRRFDLILLDIIMPGLDGFEVCGRLKQDAETADIPILFLTSMTDSECVVKGFNIGAMDYVVKPFNEAELFARVKTHLELNRSRRELKRINEQLSIEIAERKQAEKRYRDMYRNALQGMFQSTLSGKVIRANPAYARILGYRSPQEIVAIENVSKALYYYPEDRQKMIELLIERGMLTNYEMKMRRKDGEPAWVLFNVRLINDEANEPVIEGIVVDNTARKLAEEELRRSEEKFRYLAVHDNLTELYNTRYLYHALEALFRISADANSPFSLIFMDIDNFKRVVDTYGHLNGSQAIQEVAATIRGTLVEPEYGVAYGGDEFVVVLPGYDKQQAIEKAEEIRRRMRETVYLSNKGHHVRLSASFGISTYPDDAANMTHLLTQADRAMFKIKEKGKDAIGSSCEHIENIN